MSDGFASIGGSDVTLANSGVVARLGCSSSWNVTLRLRRRSFVAVTSSSVSASSERRRIFGDLTRANFVVDGVTSSRCFADVTRRLVESLSWQTNSTISLRPM